MLRATTDINVDFYDKKYILINAKQNDKNSRFLSVTCYNHGVLFPINSREHSAYIRCKKADEHSVFNFCEINNKGKITVELTEQMLAVDGICYADLVIVNKGSAKIDANTGKITVEDSGVLSTMKFCIDVSETAVENSDLESKYEFKLLNTKLEEYWANYEGVVQTAKSWAVGGTGVRDGEDVDNAKYYAGQSSTSAKGSANSEKNAQTYMTQAQGYANNAKNDATEINNRLNDMVDAFSPKGTITFEELQALTDVNAGDLYVISNDFTPDDTFKNGADGQTYPAGTTVYYTATKKWDYLIGTSVAGVKGDKETSYRKGNVNLTAENIGAISTTDIATVDEIKNYLGI